MPLLLKNRISLWLAVAAAGAAFLLVSIWSGSGSLCLVRVYTGLPCPGCGLAHAGLALMRGDVAAAFRFHPLWPLIPLYLAVLACRRNRKVEAVYSGRWFHPALLALFIFVFAARVALLFPGGAYPMVYEQGNVLMKLLSY